MGCLKSGGLLSEAFIVLCYFVLGCFISLHVCFGGPALRKALARTDLAAVELLLDGVKNVDQLVGPRFDGVCGVQS